MPRTASVRVTNELLPALCPALPFSALPFSARATCQTNPRLAADECEGHCELVAEFMGSRSADECLLRCTEACVPACAESATHAHSETIGGASSTELASELLQERVPDATALVEAL